MTNRYSRHQSVISREADSHIDENHWLKQFEKNLQKSAVQSRKVDQSLFEQINSIMGNSRSKYKSVSAAVEDMMQRSGLTDHLQNINKKSNEKINTKKASDINEESLLEQAKSAIKQKDWFTLGNALGELDKLNNSIISSVESIKKIPVKIPSGQWLMYTAGYGEGAELSDEEKNQDILNTQNALADISDKTASDKVEIKKNNKTTVPSIFTQSPAVLNTLQNIIKDTKGHSPLPAVLQRIHSIHKNDIDLKELESANVISYISNLILQERQTHSSLQDYNNSNLGIRDNNVDMDDNQDAWKALMPATR